MYGGTLQLNRIKFSYRESLLSPPVMVMYSARQLNDHIAQPLTLMQVYYNVASFVKDTL
jgi:hypothetical protein